MVTSGDRKADWKPMREPTRVLDIYFDLNGSYIVRVLFL